MIAHVHTNASDGLLSMSECLDLGEGPVLILDHLSPISAIRAHLRGHRKAPFVGAELYIRGHDKKNEHLTVFAYSARGFERLCELISACPLDSEWGWARELEGLVITTSCMASRLYHAVRGQDDDLLAEASRRIEDAGGVFAIEAFPWDLDNPEPIERAARRYAGGRILVSSDYHVPPDPGSWLAYRLGLAARPDRRETLIHPLKGGEGFYRKMREASTYVTRLQHEPIPEWLERLAPSEPVVNLGVPQPPEGEIAAFREWLESELGSLDPTHRLAVERELAILSANRDVMAYIVLVWRVVIALERKGILPFPRGSAAGSALCWTILGARSPSPVANNCVFERFYSPHRRDLPDIDLDVPDQQMAIRALREEGFRVERLCALRTLSDPEEALRVAASTLFGEVRRKEQANKNAADLARRFGCDPSDVYAAAERLCRAEFIVSFAPHPSGFVIVPPGWSFPSLPVAPREVVEAALVTGDEVPWKVDLLQSDSLHAILGPDVGPDAIPALTIAATARPTDRFSNPFRVGAAGLFQVGPASAAEAMALRGMEELCFMDLVQLVAGSRPGAVGFLFQEDAMRAVAEAARRRGLDWLRLMDAARRWSSKADERALRELESELADEQLLERLRKSGGYSFCLAHAVAYAARLLAQILLLDERPEILLDAARRERDPAWRAAILMHFLIRFFTARGGGITMRIGRRTGVVEGSIVLGEDVVAPSVISFLRRNGALRRQDIANNVLLQIISQMAGFDVASVVAAAAVIAQPKIPNPPLAGAYLWTLSRGGLRIALATPYGAFYTQAAECGLAFWDPSKGKWKRIRLESLARDARVPDPVLELEA